MKHNMPPLTIALCLSGLLVFSGCTDTLFNTKGGKLVQKEGATKEDQDKRAKNLGKNSNQDGLINEEDALNVGNGLSNEEDALNGGKNVDDNARGRDQGSRRNRPGIGLLQALSGAGGDTPLALDWNHDGTFQTAFSDIGKMVSFDFNDSGMPILVEWLKPDDRWLAIDLNNNGKIDSGAELFGSSTTLRDTLPLAQTAADGFEALAQYDTNHDGVIDRLDPVFSRLLLWEDKNSNALSESGELTNLASTKVESLSTRALNVSPSEGALAHSRAFIGYQATYQIKQNGQINRYRLVDLYFPNLYRTLSKN